MTDNPWAAWLREQEGAQVLPGGAAVTAADGAAATAADDEGDGGRDEFRGGPFGWDMAPEPRRPRRLLLLAAGTLWVLILVGALAAIARPTATVPPAAPAADSTDGGDGGGGGGMPAASGPVDGAEATADGAATVSDEVGGADAVGPPAEGLGVELGDTERAAPAGAGEVPGGLLAVPPPVGGSGEAGALLVRAALNATAGTGGPARYVDATVVTGIEPAGAAQVVSVLALVLTGDARGWEGAAVERYAVAVAQDPDGSHHAVAGPWALAPPAVPEPQAHTPEADPERLALADQALEHAGYRDIADLSLFRDPAHSGVLTVRASATAPGAAGPAQWTLWLTDTDPPAVLGSG